MNQMMKCLQTLPLIEWTVSTTNRRKKMKQNFENYFEDNHDKRIKRQGKWEKQVKDQENQLKR